MARPLSSLLSRARCVAPMNDSLDGPEKAAAWIRGEADRRGFACPDGTLLLGGAVGGLTVVGLGGLGVVGSLGLVVLFRRSRSA